MCYKPIKSYTNARYLYKDRSNLFLVQYPCGYCSDCIRKLRSQYQLRAYFEAKECFSKGGFVLFDTLTYKDSALKYFHDIDPNAIYNAWDFKCFCRDDVQRFFDVLRYHLRRGVFYKLPYYKRVGRQRKLHKCYKRVEILPPVGDVGNNLRYLLTSEYGSVLKTERPHYHLLLFVNLPIDAYTLSKYIYWSWPHGLHDGYGYKSKNYILNKRVISGSNPENLKLIRYVSKYVSKDMYTYRKLYKRVFMSFTINNPNWMHDYSKRLEFRRFKNNVLPFHFQSIGFGLAALKFEDPDYIDQYGAIRMPISDNYVIASIPLGTYFKRKLYYSLHNFDGRLMWLPNDHYYKVLPHRLEKSINSLAFRLHAFDDRYTMQFCKDASYFQLVLRGRLFPSASVGLDFSPIDSLTNMLCNNRLLFNSNSGHTRFFGRGVVTDRCSYKVGDASDIAYSQPMYLVPRIVPPDMCFVGDDDFPDYVKLLDAYTDFQRLVGVQIDFNERCKDRCSARYKDLGFISEFDFC